MKVNLAYGKTGLIVELPGDRTTVVQPSYLPGLPDQVGAIRTAVRDPVGGTAPLRKLAKPGHTVAISVCDVTRPMPSATVLPTLLRDLSHLSDQNILILVATGTHRANTDAELRQMLGDEIVDRYSVINHSAFDDSILAHAGDTPDGIPIYLNRRWLEADLKITVGFVEPHFFAGFSGGPKMVAPGLAGFDTIMRLHNSEMIGHPEARWGVTVGNPIHDAIRQISAQTGVDFALDVTINRDHLITSVYAGEPTVVHRAARRFARTVSMQPVERPFRSRAHYEQRISSRPEPLPGGKGNVSRGPGGQAGRRHNRSRRNAWTEYRITESMAACCGHRPARAKSWRQFTRPATMFTTSGRCRSRRKFR